MKNKPFAHVFLYHYTMTAHAIWMPVMPITGIFEIGNKKLKFTIDRYVYGASAGANTSHESTMKRANIEVTNMSIDAPMDDISLHVNVWMDHGHGELFEGMKDAYVTYDIDNAHANNAAAITDILAPHCNGDMSDDLMNDIMRRIDEIIDMLVDAEDERAEWDWA